MLAIDEHVDDVAAVLAKVPFDLHQAELVREQRQTKRAKKKRREQPSPHRGSSKVIDAHQLSQSTPTSAGAASMCTALISQKPACPSGSVTCPFASVRARRTLAGSSLLMATTCTFAIGLPRNRSRSGNSRARFIAY